MSNEERNKSSARPFNTMQQLMAGRLHSDFDFFKKDYQFDAMEQMARQLHIAGGPAQQSRMIQDKRRSLNRALLYSYQSAFVRKVVLVDDDEEDEIFYERGVPDIARALINPDKLKMDYDDKIISIGFEHKFKPGDVFEWLNTGSYWIIRLQDLDELAYFRGEIRRCNYTITWEDSDGKVHSTYAAIRGPVETKINYIQKHQISVDTPNYSLNIYMPKTKYTLQYFRRYAKFYLQDLQEGDENICWRVEATDSISTPGILEVTAVEYYSNEMEDDIEKGIAGGLVVKNVEPEEESTRNTIVGNVFIKPKQEVEYYFDGPLRARWSFDKKLPIKAWLDQDDIRKIKILWTSNYSGQFELKYGEYTKTIIVESLF